MKIRLGDTDYPIVGTDRLTIRQSIILQAQLRELGLDWSAEDLDAATDRANRGEGSIADTMAVLAVTIWAARSNAGEHVSLLDCADIPVGDISYVADDGHVLTEGELTEGEVDEGKVPEPTPPVLAPDAGNRAARRSRKTSSSASSAA